MADLTAEFVQKIIDLSPVETLEFGDRKYTSAGIVAVKPPVVSEMKIATLTGLRDYLATNPDSLGMSDLIIHVRDHQNVFLKSALADEWEQRHFYIHAHHEPQGFPFGRYHTIDDFIINLQTHFVPDETTAALLKLCGNLVQEANVTYSDDGVTQTVQAKTGIARVSNVDLPNPVELAPYRTFLEVAQPSSKFVFRLKKTDSGPTAALFEADGGTWTLEAIKRVRDWLRVEAPSGMTIIA